MNFGNQLNKHKNLVFLCILAVAILSLFIIFTNLYTKDLSGHQANIIFNKGDDFFADYFNVTYYSKDLDPYHSTYNGAAEKAYFPLTYVIFHWFSQFIDYDSLEVPTPTAHMQILSAILIMSGFCLILFLALEQLSDLKRGYRYLLLLCFALSGIFLFSFERGNSILIAAGCMVIFLATYTSKNPVLRELGYIALALAAALKGYPAILGLLLIYRREYKEAIRLLIYGLGFAFIPFKFLPGGFHENLNIFRANVKLNSEAYSFICNPKLGLYYFLSYGLSELPNAQKALEASMKTPIYIICIVSLLLNAFQDSTWKKTALLICITLLVPTNCGLYCALYLFPVIVLFFNEEKKWYEFIYVVLFALILNPLQSISKLNGQNIGLLIVNLAIVVLFLMLFAEAAYKTVHFIHEWIIKRKQNVISEA